MSFYPEAINRRFRSPRNPGSVTSANAAGKAVSFICGSAVGFSLTVSEASQIIEEARFSTNACGYAVAAADVIADWLRGRRLRDLHGLDATELANVVTEELSNFPLGREHCSTLAIEAVRAAFTDYRQHQVEEFLGEKALICTCFGVPEETIQKVISEIDAVEVAEVSAVCNAGLGCGSCRMLIQEMIDIADR